MIYDIIGDIHGQYEKLTGLLNKLGYEKRDGVFVPPEGHQAIFVGDLVDRGAGQLLVLETVFMMIDRGYARAVMGNHEYNAIAYATAHPKGGFIRAHTDRNTATHQAFLNEVPFGSKAHEYWLSRFFELPLWLDLGAFCVVHACWDGTAMQTLLPHLTEDNCLKKDMFTAVATTPDTEMALERILKGVEIFLPEHIFIKDGQGIDRQNVRLQWWQPDLSLPIIDISAASNCDISAISPDLVVPVDFVAGHDKPVFIGHYWLVGEPALLSDSVVCVDYSAGGGGCATAYRFDETNPKLSPENFVQYRPA